VTKQATTTTEIPKPAIAETKRKSRNPFVHRLEGRRFETPDGRLGRILAWLTYGVLEIQYDDDQETVELKEICVIAAECWRLDLFTGQPVQSPSKSSIAS
jgi:hypothetical protein